MDEWIKFLDRCLYTRLDVDTFETYVKILENKAPLPPRQIADLFLRPTSTNSIVLDPRVIRYVQSLLNLSLVDAPAVLRALLRYSSFHPPETTTTTEATAKAGSKNTRRWHASYTADEAILYRLAKLISHGASPKNSTVAVEIIRATTEWMRVVSVASAADEMLQTMGGSPATQGYEATAVRAALAALLVAVSENGKVLATFQKACPKETRRTFTQMLATFLPSIAGGFPQIAERLEAFRTQTLAPLDQDDSKEQAQKELEQMIDQTLSMGVDSIPVADLPLTNSRAGLYIYLNSLLVGRPLVDDTAIFTYLHNRYQGDIQNTVIDLILASFDVLANSNYRNEGSESNTLLRSFLINKVPLIVLALSPSMFPPLTAEYCITEALAHVDTNAFPAFSSMFDESSNNMFSDSVRQDFCFACCLHGLIPEQSIERLLGEVPMQTLPAGGRYSKDVLVQQSFADPERAERLVEELDNMDGNVGAVSQALVEVIARLCATKETMPLKTICSHLVRKPACIDILLLFEKQSAILRPLCELLDSWRYDEDQGEYQPVYEEFGSILLLVLAFVHRYNLSTVDLGLQNSDSFVAKLLIRGAMSKQLDELSEPEKKQLDGWIHGLFDGEAGGLGDELMSSCPPQDFYLLVPTLFRQIALACSTNHLSDESLKNGLEYLVDTFLLTSLVGAVTWLAHHLWEHRGDANAVIQILQTLIEPKSISNEASTMLNSILNIIAKPLEHSLRWLQRQEPSRQDIEPLSRALKPHLTFSRTGGCEHTELESWTSTAGGGLSAAIHHTIQTLVQWGLNPGVNMPPPSYSHRQILVALRIMGAHRVLQIMLDELRIQTAAGSGSVALDIVTALVCAPDAASAAAPSLTHPMGLLGDTTQSPSAPPQHRLTLRDALKFEGDNISPKASKPGDVAVEALVRLYRRVEAQSAPPVGDTSLPAVGIGGMGSDAMGLDTAGVSGLGGAAGTAGAGDVGASVTSLSDMFGTGVGDADMQMMDFGSGGGMGDDFGELRLDLGDGFS